MEALSNSLQPYKSIVGQLAGIFTVAQFFSGAIICKDIYKKGGTSGIPSIPFVGGLVIGLVMLKYGIILNDPAMLYVNLGVIGLNAIYTVFYYLYSKNKWDELLKPLSVGIAMLAVLLGYAEFENPAELEFRFGLIVTLLLVALIGAPLFDLKTIIKKKDASSIPVPITVSGTVVAVLWLLYGVILMNTFTIIQNLIALILSVIQLVLLVLYPGAKNNKDTSLKKRVKKD